MFPRFDKLIPEENSSNATLLTAVGFGTPESAAESLVRIRSVWSVSRSAAEWCTDHATHTASEPAWYQSLQRVLSEAPLKDTVLSAVEQFVRNAAEHFDPFRLFEQTPRALDILARIACGSPFLTQTLLADPICLTSLTARGRTAEMKSREQFIDESELAISSSGTRSQRLTELRKYQRRELLRIGMCDAFGLLDLRFVTLQLSLLADAMVQVCLHMASEASGVSLNDLAIIALGKHGGEELNYSSDIDLVLIATENTSAIQRLARLTIDGLADNVPPGFLYRVDLRLRPWGDAGTLVSTIDTYSHYLRYDAALWEKQALLKARNVAGNARLGLEFLQKIRPLLFLDSAQHVRTSIQQMKERIEYRLKQRGKLNSEVKLGIGSIRDVEFLVQCLQLTHGRAEPRILSFNTLDSLVRLAEFGLLNAAWYRQLRAGYVFLRTVEHSLQLLHNQQTHELPQDQHQREWLANRLDYPNAATLMQRFEEHRHAVRAIFDACLQVSHDSAVDDPESPKTAIRPTAVDPQNGARQQQIINQLIDVTASGPAVAVAFDTDQPDDATRVLIVCGTQFSGWLSIICGMISIYRIDIRSGEALTGGGRNRYGHQCPDDRFLAVFHVSRDSLAEYGLTDRLVGEALKTGNLMPELTERQLPELATRLQSELTSLCQRIADGQIEDVRGEMISRFCESVRQQPAEDATLAAVEMQVRQDAESSATWLKITGADAHGFLFELAHALFFSQFRIVRAIVDSEGEMVRDVLHVTEKDGGAIISESRLQELKVVVVLIKQFTYWLPAASDPQHALARFRELITRLQPASQWSENVQSLQRPDVLHAVARVLGISQYLWEDFLRSRHEELFPLLANARELEERAGRETLVQQMQESMVQATSSAQAWAALNAFKDRHLFRIDMRHVLGYCRPFGAFSEEITELAEIIVCKAVELAWDQLVREHGVPMSEPGVSEPQAADSTGSEPADQRACAFTIAALGKFGGIEMGYASDIELMLIFSSNGRTAGTSSISNSRFFDLLVAAVATGISARQDGIFQVDLRMRPFGQAGSAAVSLADFESYYGKNGPAWPYERQALVKFRCFAGDPEFGRKVTALCHQAIYASGEFDFVAMRAMRERQIRQLVRGGTINAKLSDGGLVDCEYAVQALQLTFGRNMATLRHSNTLRALREASRLSLISPETCAAAELAYVFLRELIDCLRMVRGNARDLTVPEPGTPDYRQLARRMQSIHDSRTPLEQLESQMQILRDFSLEVQQHCQAMRQRNDTGPGPVRIPGVWKV